VEIIVPRPARELVVKHVLAVAKKSVQKHAQMIVTRSVLVIVTKTVLMVVQITVLLLVVVLRVLKNVLIPVGILVAVHVEENSLCAKPSPSLSLKIVS
jgi:hypothetical protein